MYRWLLLVALFLAALAGLAIGVLNPEPVSVQLLLLAPSLPLGALILLAFGVGVLLGQLLVWLLFDLPARLRRRLNSKANRGPTLPVSNG